MLAIARILRTGAKLLLLDEPTEGLAPVIVQQIGNTIRMLREQGFTILLVEQNFRFAATVADRHYVVEHGQVIDMIPNAAHRGEQGEAQDLSRCVVKKEERMQHALKTWLAAGALCVAAGAAQAQYSDGTIKIGVMNDQSGTYADLSGQGSVWAAKKAIEDFCKTTKCHDKIEVVFADHQNKPDIGSNVVRQWYRRRQGRRGRRRADLLGGAGRQHHHQGEEQGVPGVGRRGLRPDRQGLQPQYGALDL